MYGPVPVWRGASRRYAYAPEVPESPLWTRAQNDANPEGRQGRATRGPEIAGLVLFVLSTSVLVGWALELSFLKSIMPAWTSMKVHTALAFLLGSGALAARSRSGAAAQKAALGLALGIMSIGLATGAEYLFDRSLHIDELAVSNRVGAPTSRMAPSTALGFVLFGAALALPHPLSRARGRLFVLFTVLAVLAPCCALVSYTLDLAELYWSGPFTSITAHTAFGFIVLFVGTSWLAPHVGWPPLVSSSSPLGSLGRLVLPAVIVLPIAIGVLSARGQAAGYYDARTGGAIMALSCALLLAAIVGRGFVRANRLEQRHEDQQRLHQSVLHTALDAFVLMDDAGRILEWNSRAQEIFGWSAQEAIGRPLAETIIPSPYRAAHTAGIARILAGGTSQILRRRNEMLAIRRDGEEFPVEFIVTPLQLGGTTVFSGFIRDVSDERRVEQQLRQAQKMEVVGQLTGGLAHDFNNLLTVTIGSLDLALAQADQDKRAPLESALAAAECGARLVQQLLAVARGQTLRPAVLDCNQVSVDMEALLRHALREDVQLELRLAPDLWAAFADRGQVENALLNLAVNARDAMKGGGKLTIETANATLDEAYVARHPDAKTGQYVLLSVSDTGMGMPAAIIERAFEPFFTTKDAGKGTGLGLSMVYGFVKQSQGHAKICSEVGRGTTVRLYLPRFMAAPETKRLSAEPCAASATGHFACACEAPARPLLSSTLGS